MLQRTNKQQTLSTATNTNTISTYLIIYTLYCDKCCNDNIYIVLYLNVAATYIYKLYVHV